MNALDLINRLETLPDTSVPRAMLWNAADGDFDVYTVDSVAPDGTLILTASAKLVLRETTDGELNDRGITAELYALQDDGQEDDVTRD